MRRLLVGGLGLSLVGCAPRETVRGIAPAGQAQPLKSARAQAAGSVVTVTGELAEVCPVAGCWFILKDGTGTLKVDTKAAGFTLQDAPLHRTVTATGKLAKDGEEPILDATGVRFGK